MTTKWREAVSGVVRVCAGLVAFGKEPSTPYLADDGFGPKLDQVLRKYPRDTINWRRRIGKWCQWTGRVLYWLLVPVAAFYVSITFWPWAEGVVKSMGWYVAVPVCVVLFALYLRDSLAENLLADD